MIQTLATLIDKKNISKNIFLVTFRSAELTKNVKPGQFIHIRINERGYPYFRRPFSYCELEKDTFSIMFNVHGYGTEQIVNSNIGSTLDVIGPLGNGFTLEDDYDIAILIAGGLGVAPIIFLTETLRNKKQIISYLGARTKDYIIDYKLDNIRIATDDGSIGYKGTVVDLLERDFINKKYSGKIKIFACGPTPMLKALSELSLKLNINCEIATEAQMICGFGTCQSCVIETKDGNQYKLVCKDGPVFNAKDIRL